jgi:hypothetical protein
MSFLEKLQKRWGLSGIRQVIIVLIVFALTGTTAVYIRRPVFAWLGITSETPWWIRVLVWIITILPAYNILLLGYGFLFGQFRFFWEFEKKMFSRFSFTKKKDNNQS